jgi:hypothetical protein
MLKFSDLIQNAVEKNVLMDDVFKMKSREGIARMKTVSNKDYKKRFSETEKQIENELEILIKEVK